MKLTLKDIKTNPALAHLWLENPKDSDEIKALDIAIADVLKVGMYRRPLMSMEVFMFADPRTIVPGTGTPATARQIHKELEGCNAVTVEVMRGPNGKQVGRLRSYCFDPELAYNQTQ